MDDGSGRDPYTAPPSGQSGWVLPPEIVPGPAPGYSYVGFWRRFCAFLIDGLIIAIPSWIITIPMLLGSLSSGPYQTIFPGRLVTDPTTGRLVLSNQDMSALMASFEGVFRWFLLAGIVIFVLQMLYFAIFWSRLGGTPGQLLLGIQVRRELDGQRISIGRGCLRYFGYLVSIWVLYIGLIWVAFDARKQGWHDKIAGTVVIRRTG